MKFEKITALLHEVDRTGVTEFEIQDGDFRLSIKKTAADAEGADAGRETAGAVSAKAAPHREEEEVSNTGGDHYPLTSRGHLPRLRQPGGAPLVTVGSTVEQGQVMGASRQ